MLQQTTEHLKLKKCGTLPSTGPALLDPTQPSLTSSSFTSPVVVDSKTPFCYVWLSDLHTHQQTFNSAFISSVDSLHLVFSTFMNRLCSILTVCVPRTMLSRRHLQLLCVLPRRPVYLPCYLRRYIRLVHCTLVYLYKHVWTISITYYYS